jgi:hypothetical protein
MDKLHKAVKKHGGLDDDDLRQVARHGADTGWGGVSHTKDTVEFYDRNEEAVWDLLEEAKDSTGAPNIMAPVAGFARADDVQDADSFKNLLSWFALEEVGRTVEEGTVGGPKKWSPRGR